ncbi:MAG: hypothetical protein WD851_20075 [Pirellulales bacterium]
MLVLLLASAAQAEVVWIEQDGDEPATIKLTVTPAPEAVPPFKHRLTVQPLDEKPGNAALWYFRALSNEGKDFKDYVRQNREEFGEPYDEWNHPSGVPLKELPLENVKKAFALFSSDVRNLHEASLRQECDWDRGIESITGPGLIMLLLPEIQQMRELARMVNLGARLAVAEGRLDDAIDLLRINYRMAQHTATEPFLVSQLVGIAIAGVGNGVLVDLIGTPDSPNLYWALTELPSPLIDMRTSIRFELEIGQRIFPFLQDAETVTHSPDEWRLMWGQALVDLTSLSDRASFTGNLPAQFGFVGLSLTNYSHAKRSLIEWGFEPERVEQMPVGQALAIYTKRIYERISQSYEKAVLVPFTDADRFEDEARRLVDRARPFSDGPDREIFPVAANLLPAVSAARNAQVRIEREFAALRVIEALRMHAAENDSELPNKLNEVTCVPVPVNPVTDQPFVYYREGKTAVLELPKSDGLHYAVRYEITIAP